MPRARATYLTNSVNLVRKEVLSSTSLFYRLAPLESEKCHFFKFQENSHFFKLLVQGQICNWQFMGERRAGRVGGAADGRDAATQLLGGEAVWQLTPQRTLPRAPDQWPGVLRGGAVAARLCSADPLCGMWRAGRPDHPRHSPPPACQYVTFAAHSFPPRTRCPRHPPEQLLRARSCPICCPGPSRALQTTRRVASPPPSPYHQRSTHPSLIVPWPTTRSARARLYLASLAPA
jgi:hypothetical protein